MGKITEATVKSIVENGRLALIGFDADKIQEYVFASSKPLEIGGASEIVKELNEDNIFSWINSSVLNKDNIIYASGGSGLIISPPSKADDIINKIEQEFHKKTITATLTAEKVICEGNDLTSNFQLVYQLLCKKLRIKKEEKNAYSIKNLTVSPYFKRCTSCGIYPVTYYDESYQEEEEKYVCESCYTKREKFRKLRKKEEYAITLEDIVKEDDSLALIYADGHAFGELFGNLDSLQEFQFISHKLAEIFDKIREETVNSLSLKKRYIAPIIGGDDLLFLLPAKKSLKATEKIVEVFRNSISSEAKLKTKTLTLDIGLVVSNHHFPVHYLFKYAAALTKNAKSLGYKNNNHTIDFMVIKGGSPLNLDIEELRKTELFIKQNNLSYRLTKRPYIFEDFQNTIIKYLKNLKDFPASQLYIISEHLLESPEVAKLNILYQIVRSDKWQNFLQKVGINSADWDKFFIEKVSDYKYQTSFLDFIELYKVKAEV